MSANHCDNESAISVRDCTLGRGVFAQRTFFSGEVILRLSGCPLTFEEAKARGDAWFDMLQIAPRLYLELPPPGLFINHSCSPNCGIAHDLLVVALREISAGEEIRYDYSTTMSERFATMRCRCGSSQCREIIGDFRQLPSALQAFYLELGVVQSFIVGVR